MGIFDRVRGLAPFKGAAGKCAAGLVLASFGWINTAAAEQVYMEHERYGAWEMTFHYDRLGSAQYTGIAQNVVLDADSASGWGATVGYNVNNQLLLGMEVMSARPDYRAVVDGQVQNTDGDYEMDFTNTHFSATWHFRPEGLTPFVVLGAGWTNVDSNIASQSPRNECWWDAWWGYTCSSYYPSYNETDFSVRAALGLRWDFHTQFFGRVSYGKHWLDPADSDAPAPTMARFEIGFRR